MSGWRSVKAIPPRDGMVWARYGNLGPFLSRYAAGAWETLSGHTLKRTVPTQWRPLSDDMEGALAGKLRHRAGPPFDRRRSGGTAALKGLDAIFAEIRG